MPSVKYYRSTLLVLASLFITVSASAQAPGASPEINRPYQQPDYEQWVERFESEGREIYDRREEIVRASGVRTGMDVADIGAGTGLFTRLFARRVGPLGRVYAVDIARNFVENIERTAAEQGLKNVVGVVNAQDSTGLPKSSVDLVFLSDTYHHFEQPLAMLASIHAALKPGGRMIIIDFERIPGKSSAWIVGHVRAGKEEVVKEVEENGFKLIRDHRLLADNFFLEFKKR